MNHVSFDLETLGRPPYGVITQIGAVKFDPRGEGLGTEFLETISIGSAVAVGLTIHPGTILWWLEQSEKAQEALKGTRDLCEVLHEFREFCSQNCGSIWSHESFDAFLLAGAYKKTNIKMPVHYRAWRDLRTLYDLAGGRPQITNDFKHNALADAKCQALEVQECFRRIRSETNH